MELTASKATPIEAETTRLKRWINAQRSLGPRRRRDRSKVLLSELRERSHLRISSQIERRASLVSDVICERKKSIVLYCAIGWADLPAILDIIDAKGRQQREGRINQSIHLANFFIRH